MTPETAEPVHVGRISYVNVLPVYHPLESGQLPHNFVFHRDPPAQLNTMMRSGELDLGSCSSIEYARRPGLYALIPNLAIASRGPVKSVLLLSSRPIRELDERPVLVSAQTHTSAALLRLLLRRQFGIRPVSVTGDVSSALTSSRPPVAFLAIGDEAMRLRDHPAYPYRLDLGQAWTELTGLPFVFGVWVVHREAARRLGPAMDAAVQTLQASKRLGASQLHDLAALAASLTGWTRADAHDYFRGLSFDLGDWELKGLARFFQWLAEAGEIEQAPPLVFYNSCPVSR